MLRNLYDTCMKERLMNVNLSENNTNLSIHTGCIMQQHKLDKLIHPIKVTIISCRGERSHKKY